MVLLAAFAPAFIVLYTDSTVPFATRFIGWILWAFCFLPAWQYFRQAQDVRPPIPFMPVMGLFYALYYARPLVFGGTNEHWRIRVDPASDYDYPAQLALEGWLMLLLGWEILRPRLRRIVVSGYNPKRMETAALVLACLGPIAQVAQVQMALPLFAAGVARFFYSLGYLGLGLLMMLVAGGRSAFVTKLGLLVLTIILAVLQFVSGFIAGFLTTAAVLFFSFWAVRRRLSARLVLAAISVALIALVVKSSLDAYRKVAWLQAGDLSNGAKLSLLATLTSQSIVEEGVVGAISNGSRSSARRSANMDLLADIVRRTPSPVPYWNGASYVSLIGLAIPRFLWPTKPTKRLGQEFGHRYSLLDANDTHTSFNLPFLVEFYANLGEAGVVLGMFLVGAIYGILARFVNRPEQDSLLTIAGIVLMLPLLNIESDFSLTFGGLLMDGFALWLVLRVIRRRGSRHNSLERTPGLPLIRSRDLLALPANR
jgi:hypothetical protein